MQNIYEVADANKKKSVLIIIFFSIFVAVSIYFIIAAMNLYFGYEPGGLGIFGIAMVVSGFLTFASYYYSDRIVLSISKAKEADRSQHFNFYTAAENLSIAAGIPKPKLYVIDDSAPNAFATGRDPEHAVVCATTGLLDKLSRTELEGVIAHEISHIRNYDIRLMALVTVMVGMVALLGDWFLRMGRFGGGDRKRGSQAQVVIFLIGIIFAILSPIIARLIKLAISRRREFMADSGSVSITKQPQGLINALIKISNDHEPLEVANKATAHLYISNPFKDSGRSGIKWFASLFNTHPPIEERIKQLKTMV